MFRVGAFLALVFVGFLASEGSAQAQGWGEQAPLQFRYSNQGITNELYRNQLGLAAAAAATSSSSLSSGGSGSNGTNQLSSQLNNAVQVTESNTYNVTISGSGNYLNVTGATVNAQQSSTGTSQTSTNKDSSAKSSSPFLN